MRHTVIKSRRPDYFPLPERWPGNWSRAAICLSKDPVADQVMACVRALTRDPLTQQVLIRPHPINLWQGLEDAVASLGDSRVIERRSGPIEAVVMVQGDEPMLTPSMIDEAAAPLIGDASVQVVNLMAPIGPDEATDPNEVKVAVDRRSNALYFSRLPLPWQDGSAHAPIFKQVCVIPFRRAFLAQFAALEPTPLEQAESIDMLRALEHGYAVRMARTAHVTCSVDTPEDLAHVSQLMRSDAV
jgi:hypothetical protein